MRSRNKHIAHPQHAPRNLTRLDRLLDTLHEILDQIVDHDAATQLLGVQVEHLQRDVGDEARDAVVGDVAAEPAQDGLQGDFVAVGERGAKGGAVG